MDKNVIEQNKKNIWLDTIEDDEAFEFTNTLFGSNWEVSQKNFVLTTKKFFFVKKIRISDCVNMQMKIIFKKVTTSFPYEINYKSKIKNM